MGLLRRSSLLLILVGAFAFIGIGGEKLINSGQHNQNKHKDPLITPPQLIDKFSFGQNELLADILWIRSIQDFEFCGANRQEEIYSEDLKRNLMTCKKGWIYQMLDAVTRLAPRYRMVYVKGALALSVVVSDFEGAALIFDRGTSAYPSDWYIHYIAGYHYAIELKNPEKAAKYMEVAGANGAPNWVPLLAAKLYNEAGRAEFGIRALKEFYKDTPYDEWPTRAKERLSELEAALKAAK